MSIYGDIYNAPPADYFVVTKICDVTVYYDGIDAWTTKDAAQGYQNPRVAERKADRFKDHGIDAEVVWLGE